MSATHTKTTSHKGEKDTCEQTWTESKDIKNRQRRDPGNGSLYTTQTTENPLLFSTFQVLKDN